jgi:hypothetical protein
MLLCQGLESSSGGEATKMLCKTSPTHLEGYRNLNAKAQFWWSWLDDISLENEGCLGKLLHFEAYEQAAQEPQMQQLLKTSFKFWAYASKPWLSMYSTSLKTHLTHQGWQRSSWASNWIVCLRLASTFKLCSLLSQQHDLAMMHSQMRILLATAQRANSKEVLWGGLT